VTVGFIDDHRDELGVEPICRALQIAPSTYYAAKRRELAPSARAMRDAVMMLMLMVLWVANRKVYGAHKLWKAARRAGHDIGRDQVARLMRVMEIEGISRQRRKVFTTRQDPDAVRAPDLVNRNFAADRPDAERDIDALLDEHGTTLREEPGIGPIPAATLLAEVGDPFGFARESKFARWSGSGAVALSSGEGAGLPVKHRLDFRGNRRINSVLFVASVVQHRDVNEALVYIDRKLGEGKTRREARRAHKRHLANRVIRRMWKDESRRRDRLIHLAA
jgi:hypothetical protein